MYLGIDAHKRYAQVAVLDEAGEIVEEAAVKNANLDDLAQRYAGAQAAIEATSNYYHSHDTLSEHLDVTVAHPKELNQHLSRRSLRPQGTRASDWSEARSE